jgi:hypothetical protein
MGLVNIGDIKPVVNMAKAVETITVWPAPTAKTEQNENEFWGRLERIITGINDLVTNAKTLNIGNQAANSRTRGTLRDEYRPPAVAVGPELPREPETPSNNEGDKKKMAIVKQLVDAAYKYLAEKSKENPNMTIGEFIMQMKVNITELTGILQMIKAYMENQK